MNRELEYKRLLESLIVKSYIVLILQMRQNFRCGVPACQGLEANNTACLLKNLNQAGGNPDD